MKKYVLTHNELKNIMRDFYMIGKNDAPEYFFDERMTLILAGRKELKGVQQ
jgi:hypothetical protein